MKTLALLLLLTTPAAAQTFGVTDDTVTPLPDLSEEIEQDVIEGGIVVEPLDINPIQSEILTRPRQAPIVRVSTAPGAVLRGLDKISGEVIDMTLAQGETAELGRLTVEMGECRYPADNPSGDAYAFLTVTAEGLDAPAFEGWMVSSSPALSALDHPRYDVWVIRCNNS
ncbi:MAG: DUF2155 domain-containing protein [Pseudomonadota bacterium]